VSQLEFGAPITSSEGAGRERALFVKLVDICARQSDYTDTSFGKSHLWEDFLRT
jgi:hypothetical protein